MVGSSSRPGRSSGIVIANPERFELVGSRGFVRQFFRCVVEHSGPRRVWLPLVALTTVLPFVLIGMPLVEKQLIDSVFLQHRADRLLGIVLTYAGLYLLSLAIGIGRSTLQTYLGERITMDLRLRLLSHSGELSLAYWHREHHGRTMALFQSDVSRVASIFNSAVIGGLAGVIGAVAGAVVMFSLNWQLAIVTALAPPLAGGLAVVLTRPLRPMSRKVQDKAAELSERLQENLAGIREVLAFGREESQGRQFATTLQQLLGLRMRLTYMDAAFQTGQSVFSLMVFLAILGYGGYLVLAGLTTLGTLIAMESLFNQTFMTAKQLFGLVRDLQVSMASIDRVYAFLDEKPQVQERPGARTPIEVAGAVTYDGVTFGYRPDRPVLQDVSFTVDPGGVIALVGPSGAGKSTMVSLLSRFYDPTAGHVLLDGTDVRDLTLAGLRRRIAIVFQDTFLFATTIRENIAFGREGATEEQIVEAARIANAWEFIERFPEQLDTLVGQRGVQLSEGQRQRLAIARALLRDPRILILDEPTSALDARSEHLLQSALQNLMRGRTTFVIAHRLATVRRADQILVLDAGRIVERGTHAELLGKAGLYRELYELQYAGATSLPDEGPDGLVPALVGPGQHRSTRS
ncbi:MAG: ABC transporter ATP-binding protein, partial [Chloroflexota bacterium]